MKLSLIHFTHDELVQWAGMGDYLLVTPDRNHQLELVYEGEPPHGDSYHNLKIDGRFFPGLAWGLHICNLLLL